MNLSDSPKTKLGTLCALYVAQGIPWGFVVITLAAHITTVLADQGKSDVEVATAVANVIALSVLPWSLKFLWGPLIDRFNYPAMGKRRPWILVAQAMMALTIGAMIFIGDIASNIALLGTMVLIHNIFNSLQTHSFH
jgi:PAT family beta-lactamase induction signal transducer AmpG